MSDRAYGYSSRGESRREALGIGGPFPTTDLT